MNVTVSKMPLKFIVTPNDEVNGNATAICKRFYASTLTKELGLVKSHAINPRTHKTCADKTNDQLIHIHAGTILNYF